MKRRLFGFVGLVSLAILGVTAAYAQDRTLRAAAGDKWLISAEAGGVNHVEGAVGIVRLNGKSGRLLKGDSIEVGDRVSTDSSGKAEILLNPGSYLRLAGNSAFEFKTTSLEDLQLKLDRGSAIFEVFATNDFRVVVNAPKSSVNIIESGVYRVDVLEDGTSRLEVWKGKAEVGGMTVKGGKVAISANGPVAVAKFDRDEKDGFELWSKDRAKDLAKATDQLKNRELRTALMRSFLGGRWNVYDSFGLWIYNAQFGRYCFLPFGYGWSSPYGYGFGSSIWWYQLPPVVFYPPTGGGGAGAGTGGGGGTTGRRLPPERQPIERSDDKERSRPPFAEIQGGPATGRKFGGGFEGGYERGGNGGGFDGGPRYNPSPVYVPAPKMEPAGSPGPTREVIPVTVKGKPDNE